MRFVKPHISSNLLTVLIIGLFMPLALSSQIDAYFNSGIFNTPKNEPYLETYLTLVGKSLATKQTEGGLQNSVNIEFKVLKDSSIIKANKYNLLGPVFLSQNNAPSFIDNQRYGLPNGTYQLELTLRDNYDSLKKPLIIKAPLLISFSDKELESSAIQPLESFRKSQSVSLITKSGYDLVPYTVNYYPETVNDLCFYFEAYNTSLALGENKPFIYTYYLELNADRTKLNSYGGFKKQISSKINPLLAKLDISKLGSGNYNLVIEIRDGENKLHLEKKYFFQRLNRAVDVAELQKQSEKENIARYIGRCNDMDTLKMYVECLWPIAGTVDKERIINQSLSKDPDVMKNFFIDFWERRAADTANPLKMWASYYQQVQQVLVLFRCGKQKGYYSERGRVYLQYGPPNQRSVQNNEHNTFPYEIWQYYRLTDGVTGQFFSNRRFVFVNKMIGDDCHTLVHSDMRGELNNPRWKFEITRRNNQGLGNPDNEDPDNTQFNQFDEIYNNPR